MTDDSLLDLIARDPEDAIRQAIERHGGRLLGRIRKHARDRRYGDSDTDDIFQQAILQLLKPELRKQIRAAGGEILPFLSRWAYWRLDDLAQARAREAEEVRTSLDPGVPTTPSAAAELVKRVATQLSPRDRIVLTMRYSERLSNAEVGDRLEISEGAAKKAAHDARRRLRDLLESEGIQFEQTKRHDAR